MREAERERGTDRERERETSTRVVLSTINARIIILELNIQIGVFLQNRSSLYSTYDEIGESGGRPRIVRRPNVRFPVQVGRRTDL